MLTLADLIRAGQELNPHLDWVQGEEFHFDDKGCITGACAVGFAWLGLFHGFRDNPKDVLGYYYSESLEHLTDPASEYDVADVISFNDHFSLKDALEIARHIVIVIDDPALAQQKIVECMAIAEEAEQLASAE